MGIRGSDTHSILFNDVKVPKENRIGEDGFGFKFAMKTLAGGRIGIASQALGIASGAYELSVKYSKERKAFGTEIMNHQAIAFKLADMATRIEAARLLCLKAAWEKDNNHGLYTQQLNGKSICFRNSNVDYNRSCADTWWLWFCKRIPCRAINAGCQDHPDI